MRVALLVLVVAGCVINTGAALQVASGPPPSGGGSATCAEIVQSCDVSCRDPLCLRNCTAQGSPEGAQQHNALLDCGQSYNCLDESCMRQNCPTEVGACEASAQPQQQPQGQGPGGQSAY